MDLKYKIQYGFGFSLAPSHPYCCCCYLLAYGNARENTVYIRKSLCKSAVHFFHFISILCYVQMKLRQHLHTWQDNGINFRVTTMHQMIVNKKILKHCHIATSRNHNRAKVPKHSLKGDVTWPYKSACWTLFIHTYAKLKIQNASIWPYRR